MCRQSSVSRSVPMGPWELSPRSSKNRRPRPRSDRTLKSSARDASTSDLKNSARVDKSLPWS